MAIHSSALVADAAHSLSDLLSDVVTLWSVKVARLPPDPKHPYGRLDCAVVLYVFDMVSAEHDK